MTTRKSPVARALAALRGALAGALLVSLVINLLMLTGPLFMLQVYDRVLASGSVPTLAALAGLAAVLYVFFGLFEALRSRMLARMGQGLDLKLSGAAFELSSRLPLRLGTGAERLRPVQDIDTLRQFVAGPGPSAIFDLPWIPVYLAVVFLFHAMLGMAAFAGAAVIIALMIANELASRAPEREMAAQAARRAALVEAGRRNAEAVQAMGMLPALAARWRAANDSFLASQRRAGDGAAGFGATIKAAASCCNRRCSASAPGSRSARR